MAYNNYMNAVDQMDQLWSTNPTRKKEIHVEMSIYTIILDLSVNNAYALYKKILPTNKSPSCFHNFKQKVCAHLIDSYLLSHHTQSVAEVTGTVSVNVGHVPESAEILVNHFLTL